ncbi:MAG: outer membrane beta-barrel protein [Candidatus Aminicenantes bacterium]|nr:outer membrane beta-barrel protein [Candidatus Aminicenantes bacterium]
MINGKRTRALPAAGLIIVGLLASSLGAATYESRRLALAVGLNGNFNMNSAEDHRNAFGFGATLLIALTRNFALELSGQYSRCSTLGDMAAPNASLSQGVLQRIPVQMMIQVRVPFGAFPLVPYITGGGGLSFNSFTLDAGMVAAYQGFGFDIAENIKNSPVWCVGGGFDLIPSSHLIINIHFLYHSSLASGDWSITDEISGETVRGTLEPLNLKDMTLGLGLKFVF